VKLFQLDKRVDNRKTFARFFSLEIVKKLFMFRLIFRSEIELQIKTIELKKGKRERKRIKILFEILYLLSAWDYSLDSGKFFAEKGDLLEELGDFDKDLFWIFVEGISDRFKFWVV
jgi:hypothetical protein